MFLFPSLWFLTILSYPFIPTVRRIIYVRLGQPIPIIGAYYFMLFHISSQELGPTLSQEFAQRRTAVEDQQRVGPFLSFWFYFLCYYYYNYYCYYFCLLLLNHSVLQSFLFKNDKRVPLFDNPPRPSSSSQIHKKEWDQVPRSLYEIT